MLSKQIFVLGTALLLSACNQMNLQPISYNDKQAFDTSALDDVEDWSDTGYSRGMF